MKTAIAVFVKTPTLSPVKTRLAKGIGRDNATRFYLLSIAAISQTLKTIDANCSWAVGEEAGLSSPLWGDFNAIYTGTGDLGDRQSHIYNALLDDYDRVVLIGADAPQISIEIFNDAINDDGFVIGAANDGGYYLFAGCEKVPLETWRKVPWSSDKTLEVLETLLPYKSRRLEILNDIDTIDDLKCLSEQMPRNKNAAQQRLVDWVEKL